MAPASAQMLDRVLDPLGRALGPDAARNIVALRADVDAQRRVDELAERANEGVLTPEERSEYESLLAAATVIGVLQAKARAVIAARKPE
ncbi:MAG TPA: hypothetical protein VFB66_17400 [Tepidisphaeraceae bacterium]|nr:hypothetical protein [Tepidisphaeraceae bacterium]